MLAHLGITAAAIVAVHVVGLTVLVVAFLRSPCRGGL